MEMKLQLASVAIELWVISAWIIGGSLVIWVVWRVLRCLTNLDRLLRLYSECENEYEQEESKL